MTTTTHHICGSCGADPDVEPTRVARVWKRLTARLPGRAQSIARDGLIAYAAVNLVGDAIALGALILGAVGIGAWLA